MGHEPIVEHVIVPTRMEFHVLRFIERAAGERQLAARPAARARPTRVTPMNGRLVLSVPINVPPAMTTTVREAQGQLPRLLWPWRPTGSLVRVNPLCRRSSRGVSAAAMPGAGVMRVDAAAQKFAVTRDRGSVRPVSL
jgi:hypothetical protein